MVLALVRNGRFCWPIILSQHLAVNVVDKESDREFFAISFDIDRARYIEPPVQDQSPSCRPLRREAVCRCHSIISRRGF